MHGDGEAELLRELAEGVRPRGFAVYELIRDEDGGEVVDAELCVWGLDCTAQRPPGSDDAGAVFMSPHGMLGNAESAEATFEMFAMIREVRLVWL
ncbi:hypothetical protein GCM10027271_41530 [Saccharopolyspora gloriosae]|uniref:Uncharacterized protein n=1 Tax=Saccharopolyspora gloriosae TaxID=455344 RepID=A0A840NGN5_9PSEU|nr:hypothetical protein [Saccharopolyspora gloriosae]MBB5070744.1 hypothetical protein [Saccharopolyspora gloriosae]